MTLTAAPTAQRLDELDLAIRQLAVLAETADPQHRHFLTLEAIGLDDELWRIQLRSANDADGVKVGLMIENLGADVDRLRNRLDELDPEALDHLHPVAEPIAA